MVRKIIFAILLLICNKLVSQNFNNIYNVDKNINVQPINISDTNVQFKYYNDSNVFSTLKELNQFYSIYLEEDTNYNIIFKILNKSFELKEIPNLASFGSEAINTINKLTISHACIITSKLNFEKYLVLFGYNEPSYGVRFVRYVFVFKINDIEIANSFFYTTTDLSGNQEQLCLGCFININKGKSIGFKDWMHYKNYYKIHYIYDGKIKTITKPLIPK